MSALKYGVTLQFYAFSEIHVSDTHDRSAVKTKKSKSQDLPVMRLMDKHILPGKWKQQIPPKTWYQPTNLHSNRTRDRQQQGISQTRKP
jgi:hypothetical protein